MEIVRHERNPTGRDFVCSDLHGMLHKFYDALKRVDFDPSKDRVFCGGDLIDRGDNSERCLRLIEKPWFYSIRGNHEDMLLMGFLQPDGQRMHSSHGGEWFYKLDKQTREDLARAVASLPYAFEIDTPTGIVGMVHADAVVDWKHIREALDGTTPDQYDACIASIVWGNQRYKKRLQTPVHGIDRVYVGHVPHRFVETLGNVTYIDGGACYGVNRIVNLLQIA